MLLKRIGILVSRQLKDGRVCITERDIRMESRVLLQGVSNIAVIRSQSPRATLNSWKEIARYMRMGVRTIQRYEAQLGLPVHRTLGKSPSSVFAFSDEIDRWLALSPTRPNAKAARMCEAFSSLFEALRSHARSCPHCAGNLGARQEMIKLAS